MHTHTISSASVLLLTTSILQESFYAECLEATTRTSRLLSELSSLRADQQECHFDLSTIEGATAARSEYAKLRERLINEYSHPIEESVKEADRLCIEGADTLSPEQFHQLKENRHKLWSGFGTLLKQTDAVLDRLDVATALLIEFSTKSSQFQSWIFEKSREIDALRSGIGPTRDQLEVSKQSFKTLDGEIIAKREELSALSQLAIRIEVEICTYIEELQRRQKDAESSASALSASPRHLGKEQHQINKTIERIQEDYAALIRAKNELWQFMNRMRHLYQQYEQSLVEVGNWLAELERNISSALISSKDPEERLTQLLHVQQSAVQNHSALETFTQSAHHLIDAYAGTGTHEKVQQECNAGVDNVQKRFGNMSKKLADGMDAARAELTQKDGLDKGIEGINQWLTDTEANLADGNKPLPLKLSELQSLEYDRQLRRGELDSKRKTLEELFVILERMKKSSVAASTTQKNTELEQRLVQAQRRYDRLTATVKALDDSLHELIAKVQGVHSAHTKLGEEVALLEEEVGSASLAEQEEKLSEDIARLTAQDWPEFRALARGVLTHPGVTEDSRPIDELLRAAESALSNLRKAYESKLIRGRRATERGQKFFGDASAICGQLASVESKIEEEYSRLSVDLVALQAQHGRGNVLGTELSEIRRNIEAAEELGEELVHAMTATQAAGGLIPSKRESLMMGKPVGGGRNEGSAAIRITQQLLELRRKEEHAEKSLAHLVERISKNDEMRRGWNAKYDAMERWVGEARLQLSQLQQRQQEFGALSPKELQIKIDELNLRRRAQQSTELAALQLHTQQLLQLANDAESKEEVNAQMGRLLKALEQLDQTSAEMEKGGELLHHLAEELSRLDKWLASKTKMMEQVLSPTADPNVINSQLVVLQIVTDERAEEEPKWLKFNEMAGKLAKDGSASHSMESAVTGINSRWNSFTDSVGAWQQKLNLLKNLCDAFTALHREIRKDLLKVEEGITTATQHTSSSEVEKLQLLAQLEQVTESTKPNVEELKEHCGRIEQLVDDPAASEETRSRVSAALLTLGELEKRIQSAIKAIKSANVEEGELGRQLNALLAWVEQHGSKMEEQFAQLHVERSRLAEQMEKLGQLHSEIMAKDGEILVVSAKAGEILNKSFNSTLSKKLCTLNEKWPLLLATVRTQYQLVEKWRKLVHELAEMDDKVKEKLLDTRRRLETASKGTDRNSASAQELMAIQKELEHVTGLLDSASNVITRMESIFGDSKRSMDKLTKTRLVWEDYRRQHSTMLADCKRLANTDRIKSTLRSKFETEAGAMHELLTVVRRNFQLDNPAELNMGKEALALGLNDFDAKWLRFSNELNATADRLDKDTGSSERDSAEVKAKVVALENKADELRSLFGAKLTKLQEGVSSVEAVQRGQEQLVDEVNELLERCASFAPISREVDLLKSQADECEVVLAAMDNQTAGVNRVGDEWRKVTDKGLASMRQNASAHKELDRFRRQLDRGKAEVRQRAKSISWVKQRLEELDKDSAVFLAEVERLMATQALKGLEGPSSETSSTDLASLRQQRTVLKHKREEEMSQTAEKRERIIKAYRELIRSAAPQVSTSTLEAQVGQVDECWQKLTALVEGQERKLESAIQGLGSYDESYRFLCNWLEETEELVNNQRPPASDPKVTRAQLQNIDFQLKLIDDKQANVDGFIALADKLQRATSSDTQKEQFKAKSHEVTARYNSLLDAVNGRRRNLQEAQLLGQELSQLSLALTGFLDETEKALVSLGNIPTDAEHLDAQVQLQKELQARTDAQRRDFDRLVAVCTALVRLVGVEDANELEAMVRSLGTRYNEVGMRCRNCGGLLATLGEDITNFLSNTALLAEWLANAEIELGKFEEMPVHSPERLIEQSEQLTKLAIAFAEQGALVSQVVEDSRELCSHASGSEAVALQYKIDQLRNGYSKLAAEADERINNMSKAIPLSEELCDGFDELRKFLHNVEVDLEGLDSLTPEERSHILTSIDADCQQYRTNLESLQAMSIELKYLRGGSKATELEAENAKLIQQFVALADSVARKVGQSRDTDRQSRYTFDVLDFWVDWFVEICENLSQADKPSVDMEQLKAQLKEQRLLNDEIANERAGLRDVVLEASRAMRELSAEGQEAALIAKIERAKKLAEEAAARSQDRTMLLEQAFALCKELDSTYTELNDWMDEMEIELRECDPVTTGMSPKALFQQQIHNNNMLQTIQNQRPTLARFERNAHGLSELCNAQDAANLRQIADQLLERFQQLSNAFRERGEALNATIEQSSKFSGRLDVFLANLEGAAAQIRSSEPPSCRPQLLRKQLEDNTAIVELLHTKEGAFRRMKENANEMIAQARGNEMATREVSKNIERLDELWLELHSNAIARDRLLRECLGKGEHFWSQFEVQQRVVHQLHQIFESIPSNGVDPERIVAFQQTLHDAESTLHSVSAGMPILEECGRQLCELLVAEEERHYVEQHMQQLQSGCTGLVTTHARLTSGLLSSMENAMQFHSLLQELSSWLGEIEKRELPQLASPDPSCAVEKIRTTLDLIEKIRRSLDEKAHQRDLLSRVAAELCIGAEEAPSIRSSVAEINERWSRISATLNERQHRMDRCLLKMGQFTQAHKQFSVWLDKTLDTLRQSVATCEGLDPKEIEVELCKAKVFQNEIASHRPSYDAIEKAAGLIMKSNDGPSSLETHQLIEALSEKWATLTRMADELVVELEQSKHEASYRSSELNKWMVWLKDILGELKTSKPIGGLPETANAQLDEFRIVLEDVEQKRCDLESSLVEIHEQLLGQTHGEKSWLRGAYSQLKGLRDRVEVALTEREKRLMEALREAIEMETGMREMEDWLTSAEDALSLMDPSMIPRILAALREVVAKHAAFNEEVHQNREKLKELQNKGVRVQLSCEKKDAIPMKNKLITLKTRAHKVGQRVLERTRQLDSAMNEAQMFYNSVEELLQWLDAGVAEMEGRSTQPLVGERVKEMLEEQLAFQSQLQRREPSYTLTCQRGKFLEAIRQKLVERAPPGEKREIAALRDNLQRKWEHLSELSSKRQRSLEEALIQCGQFDEIIAQLTRWLDSALPGLEEELANGNFMGDLTTLHALSKENCKLVEEIASHKQDIEGIRGRAARMVASPETSASEREDVERRMKALELAWKRVEVASTKKEEQLTSALKSAVDLDELDHELKGSLSSIEARLRRGSVPQSEEEVNEGMENLAKLKGELNDLADKHESLMKLAHHIHSKCHPRAELSMRELIRVSAGRWDLVEHLAREQGDKLKESLDGIKAQEKQVEELLDYVKEKRAEFDIFRGSDDQGQLNLLLTSIGELDMFLNLLQTSKVEEVLLSLKRMAPPATSENPLKRGTGVLSQAKSNSVSPAKANSSRKSQKAQQEHSPKRVTHKQKADELEEMWNSLLAEGRAFEEKLKDRKAHLEELKRLENFTFDDWRDRYLKWNDHGKARISDLFRRIDRPSTGKIPRALFIEGILSSKFTTTEAEMNKVADEFDKGDGEISAKEFINALRYDPRKKKAGASTETERIHEEIARETSRCTCAHRFPIHHISTDNKDRVHYGFGFGGSMKRMVRILRSTVMVRVGGGWEPLEKFLEKHDPCRARGRTNIELFCDELRNSGAGSVLSDQMESFTFRRPDGSSPYSSRTSSASGIFTAPVMGPVTKVREKTDRSVPMFTKSTQKPHTSSSHQHQSTLRSYAERRDSDISSAASDIFSPRLPTTSSSNVEGGGRDSRPLSRSSDLASVDLQHTRIPSLRAAKGVRFAIGSGGRQSGSSSSQQNSPRLSKETP